MRGLWALVFLGLSACAGAQGEHVVISKPGVEVAAASRDIADCRYEGEMAAGAPQMVSYLNAAAWIGHRNRLISLCLERRGYGVMRAPGACVGQCIGNVEVRG